MRGNNRQPIFLDPADYQQYLTELSRARQEEPHHVLAYALMPNHVHLVIEAVPDGSPSAAMQQVSVNYTRYFNVRYGRVGQLYQGRFYSNLVDRERYLLEVTRYVHLNPVRARLVIRPIEYPWSSYAIYLGVMRNHLEIVEPERILALFGSTHKEQTESYSQFVEEMVDKEAECEMWVRRLQRNKVIPPRRWLT
jgi:REP element-mobilizing transposase RayT